MAGHAEGPAEVALLDQQLLEGRYGSVVAQLAGAAEVGEFAQPQQRLAALGHRAGVGTDVNEPTARILGKGVENRGGRGELVEQRVEIVECWRRARRRRCRRRARVTRLCGLELCQQIGVPWRGGATARRLDMVAQAVEGEQQQVDQHRLDRHLTLAHVGEQGLEAVGEGLQGQIAESARAALDRMHPAEDRVDGFPVVGSFTAGGKARFGGF